MGFRIGFKIGFKVGPEIGFQMGFKIGFEIGFQMEFKILTFRQCFSPHEKTRMCSAVNDLQAHNAPVVAGCDSPQTIAVLQSQQDVIAATVAHSASTVSDRRMV